MENPLSPVFRSVEGGQILSARDILRLYHAINVFPSKTEEECEMWASLQEKLIVAYASVEAQEHTEGSE